MSDLGKRIEAALAKIAQEDHEVAFAIHAALSTQEGRRAAGLPRKGRGRSLDLRDATIGSKRFEIAYEVASGKINKTYGIALMADLLRVEERTAKEYLDQILPAAKALFISLQLAK